MLEAADAAKAMAAIADAVAVGDLTPAEAGELTKLVDTYVRAIEATDLEVRVRALEEARGGHEVPQPTSPFRSDGTA